MSIFKYDDIDLSKITYKKPEKQGSFYYSSISYNNKPLHIQCPKMKSTITGSEILKKNPTNLMCEPINNDFSFYDFFLGIDDRNIKETFKKNKEWFDKQIPLELIDDMYKRTIKPVKKDCKPSFSFKIPIIKNKVQCQIYDQNKICQDITRINEDSELIFVLHIRGLKFLKQNYYCDCYISQIKLTISNDDKYNIFTECIIEDDEDKKEDFDIIDEEILNEMKKEKQMKIEKENKKKRLEEQISELKKELDNL
tara:strand:+ start:258 stop:1016 length:759 start_codon:yes stop_codon:yes gene_type:complete